jgi:pre-rRNA-processing protein IPI1
MEIHFSPLITCIPGLISNAADDSKGYLLEVGLISLDCSVKYGGYFITLSK